MIMMTEMQARTVVVAGYSGCTEYLLWQINYHSNL
jgi:hypothetical protein